MSPEPRALRPYDAILVCGFGGPDRPEDVMPFLHAVTAGRGIPEARLAQVATHYARFGGRSPINRLSLALVRALAGELQRRGLFVPVLWGNRNWHPYSVDVLRDARAFGARRVLAVLTSAYASYSSSRQYLEHLDAAVAALGAPRLRVDVLRPYFNAPGFARANIQAILEAAGRLGSLDGAHVAYVTHSIPVPMQQASAATGPGYREQHLDVAATIDRELAARTGARFTSSLSYCSRSGRPGSPWLEPDIGARLEQVAAHRVQRVVIAPIGFVSDHMEVVYDLDTQAAARARELGLRVERAGTAGTRPAFVAGLADLVEERAARERGECVEPAVVGSLPAFPDVAPPDACLRRPAQAAGAQRGASAAPERSVR